MEKITEIFLVTAQDLFGLSFNKPFTRADIYRKATECHFRPCFREVADLISHFDDVLDDTPIEVVVESSIENVGFTTISVCKRNGEVLIFKEAETLFATTRFCFFR